MSDDVCFCFSFFFFIFFPRVIICFSSCRLNLCNLCIIFGIPISALSLMVGHGSDDIFLNVSLTDIIVDCGCTGVGVVVFSLYGSIICVTEDLGWRGIIGSSYAINIWSAVLSIENTSALSPASSMWWDAVESRSVRIFALVLVSCW